MVEHGRDPPNPVDDLLPLVGADLVDEAIRGGPTVAQRTTMHHAAQASGEEGAPERASVCVCEYVCVCVVVVVLAGWVDGWACEGQVKGAFRQ